MGWFGGGSDGANGAPREADFSSSDESSFSEGMTAPSSLGAGGGAASEMQQFSMALRQQIVVQQAISKISDVAFEKCIVSKPGDSLSSKEAGCIHATTNKWLDTNEYMMGRLAKKQEAASGSPSFS